MPLNVAPSGRAASAAPLTPAASCAATGPGAMRVASPRIAADRNPSRVIVSPSVATLLVDHDVPADNWARATLVDVRAELVGVCDLEHVIALARIPMVLDVRLEVARRAVRAAGARELCRGGGEHRHQGDRAIEVCPRHMVQVIEMAATSHSSLVFRVEAEGALATRDVDLDLAAAGGLPGGYAANACPARCGRDEPGLEVSIAHYLLAGPHGVLSGTERPTGRVPPVAGGTRPVGLSVPLRTPWGPARR